MTNVYLKNVGGDDECWIVCAKGDPGAVLFSSQDKPTDKHREAARALQLAMSIIVARGDTITIVATEAPMIIKALRLLAKENVK